eukprot:98560-Rhodomonas_salina.3
MCRAARWHQQCAHLGAVLVNLALDGADGGDEGGVLVPGVQLAVEREEEARGQRKRQVDRHQHSIRAIEVQTFEPGVARLLIGSLRLGEDRRELERDGADEHGREGEEDDEEVEDVDAAVLHRGVVLEDADALPGLEQALPERAALTDLRDQR